MAVAVEPSVQSVLEDVPVLAVCRFDVTAMCQPSDVAGCGWLVKEQALVCVVFCVFDVESVEADVLVPCLHCCDRSIDVVNVQNVVAAVLHEPVPVGVGAHHVFEQVVELLSDWVVLECHHDVLVFFGQACGFGVADCGVDPSAVSAFIELGAHSVQCLVCDRRCFVAPVGAHVNGY